VIFSSIKSFLCLRIHFQKRLPVGKLTEKGRQKGVGSLNDATLILNVLTQTKTDFYHTGNSRMLSYLKTKLEVKKFSFEQYLGRGSEHNLATLRVLLSKIIDVEYKCQ
jgi:hypothetical protein